MAVTLTREQFHALVWSLPVKQLSQHLGVSNVTISTRARAANIPLPPVGFWQKVNSGAPPQRISLPPADLLTSGEVYFPGELPSELTTLAEDFAGRIDDDEPIEILSGRLKKRISAAPRRKTKALHPSIDRIRVKDLNRKWEAPSFASQKGKRLLILASNVLFLCDGLGCRTSARESNGVLEMDLGLGVSWFLALKVDRRTGDISMGPADDSLLSYMGLRIFRDTPQRPLEDRVEEAILHFAERTALLKRKWQAEAAERERTALIQGRTDRKIQYIHRRRAMFSHERSRQKRAIRDAKRWHEAELLREYAEAYLARAIRDDDAAHARWLRRMADELDPLLRRAR